MTLKKGFLGLLALLAAISLVLAGEPCPLGFQACPNGSCTLFPASQCQICAAGQLVCPMTQQCATSYTLCQSLPSFLNWTLPVAERVADLVARMNVTEKISQMMFEAPAIERLGIPNYSWLNEACHGVARAGLATSFPQTVGLGATFDEALYREVGSTIALEGRAKYNAALRAGKRIDYHGLTFYVPNINLARDPRWGRNQEVPGEDPFLNGKYAGALVSAMQYNESVPDYLQTVGCCKHFVAYSLDDVSPWLNRFNYDATVSQQDLWQSYFPHFRRCVQEGGAKSVMCSYNSLNGVPTCGDPWLLQDVLRDEFGFDGFVITDYDSIACIYYNHNYTNSLQAAAVLGLSAGVDQDGGTSFTTLVNASAHGEVDPNDLDRAISNLFSVRIRLGMLDPPNLVPFNSIPFSVVADTTNTALALQAARESIVLLANNGEVPLPWESNQFQQIAVLGPNANATQALLGNYAGSPAWVASPLWGIQSRSSAATQVLYSAGCADVHCNNSMGFADTLALVHNLDSNSAVVMVMGLDITVENEMLDRIDNITLPGLQESLIMQVAQLKPPSAPLVLVLINGGIVPLSSAVRGYCNAIIEAWYPGEQGGAAIADVLFGRYNPAGRLPVTVYEGLDQLPPYTSMAMNENPGRTYRYFRDDPQYPFGFGLSYTTFAYSNLALPSGDSIAPCQNITLTATVSNTGAMAGDEVVQVYLMWAAADSTAPNQQLAAFSRVQNLAAGDWTTVALEIDYWSMSLADTNGSVWIQPGTIKFFVGGGQPRYAEGLFGSFEIVGKQQLASNC